MTHLFPDGEIRGTVVKPGPSRGGLYVRVLVDETEKTEPTGRTFARSYWVVTEDN